MVGYDEGEGIIKIFTVIWKLQKINVSKMSKNCNILNIWSISTKLISNKPKLNSYIHSRVVSSDQHDCHVQPGVKIIKTFFFVTDASVK